MRLPKMYKSRAFYYTRDRFELNASLGWWRWNEVGFQLEFQHNVGPGGLRNLYRFRNEELLWWQFLWASGHFKLSWGLKDNRKAKQKGLVYAVYGDLSPNKQLTTR